MRAQQVTDREQQRTADLLSSFDCLPMGVLTVNRPSFGAESGQTKVFARIDEFDPEGRFAGRTMVEEIEIHFYRGSRTGSADGTYDVEYWNGISVFNGMEAAARILSMHDRLVDAGWRPSSSRTPVFHAHGNDGRVEVDLTSLALRAVGRWSPS